MRHHISTNFQGATASCRVFRRFAGDLNDDSRLNSTSGFGFPPFGVIHSVQALQVALSKTVHVVIFLHERRTYAVALSFLCVCCFSFVCVIPARRGKTKNPGRRPSALRKQKSQSARAVQRLSLTCAHICMPVPSARGARGHMGNV